MTTRDKVNPDHSVIPSIRKKEEIQFDKEKISLDKKKIDTRSFVRLTT